MKICNYMRKKVFIILTLLFMTCIFAGCEKCKCSEKDKITGKSLLPSDISSSIKKKAKSFMQFESIAGAMISFDRLQEKVPDDYLKEVGLEIDGVYETDPETLGSDLYICYGKNTKVDEATLKKAVKALSSSDDEYNVGIGKEATNQHACMLFYTYNDCSNYSISFSQKADAEDFLAQIKDYDYKLEVKKGKLILPRKKSDKVSLIKIADTAQIEDDESFRLQFSDIIQEDKDGWYYIGTKIIYL